MKMDTKLARAISPNATTALSLMSWHGGDLLEATLETYRKADLFSLFDKVLILFQEMDDDDRRIIEKFDLPYIVSQKNVGIETGLHMAADHLDTDYMLLLENDCPLIASRDEVIAQLTLACKRLADGTVDQYRLRSRWDPGEKFDTVDKFARYHLVPGETSNALKSLRRFLRPEKYRRLIGTAVYLFETPDQPQYQPFIKIQPEGDIIVSSAVLPWTNQSVLVKRSYLLDMLAYAAAHPVGVGNGGFPNLEKPLNVKWWRQQDFKIGVSEGLFTHKRDFFRKR